MISAQNYVCLEGKIMDRWILNIFGLFLMTLNVYLYMVAAAVLLVCGVGAVVLACLGKWAVLPAVVESVVWSKMELVEGTLGYQVRRHNPEISSPCPRFGSLHRSRST